jgi:predicted 5'-methylthioadenosine/S-adenosylhomocysteine nucleosidase
VLVVAATQRELSLLEGVDTFCCGIGPVEAAAQTARRLAEGKPDAVLHIGVAGSRTLEPLSLVIGSEAVYCDVAAEIPVIDRARPDAALLAQCRAALPDAAVVPIGTSAAVGGGSCEIEAMEGFGVVRACELAGVPAVELRAISNSVDEPDRSKWKLEDAIAALAEAVDRVLRSAS